MRNEYDHRDMIGSDGGLTRWLPSVVVVAVMISFVTLAWYAYHAGTQSLKDDDLIVVEADKTPIKEKPTDPGGMQFPDQDKTVFDTFATTPRQPPKVETVLPAPEEPLPKSADASGTTTWVNDKLHAPKDVVVAAKPEAKAEQKTPPNTAPAPEQVLDQVIGTADKAKKAPAATPASGIVVAQADTEEKTAPPVTIPPPVVETSVEAEKPVKPEAPKKTVPAAAVAAAKPSAANDNKIKVQLGAYRSEKEARDTWNKILKKNPVLADHEPLVVKADLGAKGVYYRLRVGGFDDASDAKAFCAKLTAGGQACLLAN